jgi:hypothetical protein
LRSDKYPFCEYSHPSSDSTKGACYHLELAASTIQGRKTTYGECSSITDPNKCSKNYMPGYDWNRCFWWMGPRLYMARRHCQHYNAILIQILTNVEFMACDKACSEHYLCKSFFYGRAETGSNRRCYLQAHDSTANSNQPCTPTSNTE